MKAMAFVEPGDVDAIQEMDLPEPVLEPGEVLVRVRACGLNHLDLWVRRGLPIKIPMPHIGGCETVGHIEKLGQAVDDRRFPIGQAVMISPTQGCGQCPACFRADEPACRKFVIPGEHSQGGFAEFARAPARHIIPLSDNLTLAEWAATPLTFVTAWRMLHGKARIQPGDVVLVQAAASGVGSAAIQIAKQAGATVFTTAGSEPKLQLGRELGADVAINYREENFAEVIKKETGGRGVDIIIEHVGESIWKDALRSLAHGGRLVTCGATTGPHVALDLRYFFIKEHQILGSCMGSRAELDSAMKLLDRGILKPVVDRTFPLEQLRNAHQYLEDRLACGKVVITVD